MTRGFPETDIAARGSVSGTRYQVKPNGPAAEC
jgi:hypothetical protein